MLLERLLKFIRQEEKPVNAVLAGYFSKLVTLLINRKSKSLFPYIFGQSSDFVDCLLHHVYQKSLSELITKLLNISEETARNASNEEVNVAASVKERQAHILNRLIEKLSPTASEEDNWNAAGILQDSLETKDFYAVVSKRHNVARLLDFALPEAEASFDS